MSVEFDFSDRVALVTGASGALGSVVAETFERAGATVAAVDVMEPPGEGGLLETEGRIEFYRADLTEEREVERVVEEIVDDQGRLDFLLNVAGAWRGGTHVEDTDVETFETMFDVNLKTMFLTSKHALPHLQERSGSIVSVSARASLSGGEGDGPYRASKAGVRLLTETIAEENLGTVQANAVMPSVIDTPTNRELIPDADHEAWVDPESIADVMLFLCSAASEATSGAAIPVYGEA